MLGEGLIDVLFPFHPGTHMCAPSSCASYLSFSIQSYLTDSGASVELPVDPTVIAIITR